MSPSVKTSPAHTEPSQSDDRKRKKPQASDFAADDEAAGENQDDAAEFVHDLAEDSPPKDLETVKAATDAKEADSSG